MRKRFRYTAMAAMKNAAQKFGADPVGGTDAWKETSLGTGFPESER